nr:hypothetical protein [uncultured Pseudomonas sp.]
MSPNNITIINDRTKEIAELIYDSALTTLSVNFADGSSITGSGNNLFECFSQIRSLRPDIVFLCKGAKRNVYPSRMSSQMASGLLAYELKLGEQALKNDIVNIFDYDEMDIAKSPNDQAEFFKKWLNSLK